MFKGLNRRAFRLAVGALVAFVLGGALSLRVANADVPAFETDGLQWLKIRAEGKEGRSAVANYGVSPEAFRDGFVYATGSVGQRDRLRAAGLLESSFSIDARFWDFPAADANFHNAERMTADLQALAAANPDIAALESIGESYEKRPIWKLRISKDPANASSKPGTAIMGGHHAREHLSMEMPLLLARKLIDGYRKGDAEIVRLVETRDIHIIPMCNPDGAEYDISGGRYRMWRKNRSPQGRDYGVDLNRNYGYQWGTGGSSSDPTSEVYKGPAPFSEPETRALRDFVERQTNIATLLTLHTFSELVLYPWGWTYDSISNGRDHDVFDKMARTMAGWNGYTPQQSSALYQASGDTTDWAYGAHKIFAFTFELDPTSMWSGGFYPGQDKIEPVFQKNLKPMLYLIDLADNPYRATEKASAAAGVPALGF